jgi:lipopolysaccharide transport system ATP-binding protein
MNSDAVMRLQNVSFAFKVRSGIWSVKKEQVLNRLNFNLYRGEKLGVLGLNGAGKSTLLRLLAGIYQPSTGALFSSARKVSLMTLGLGFDPVLNGRDNAIFGSMLLGCSRQEALASLGRIHEFSELGEKFNEPIKTYSTGMVTRLAFSIASMLEADLLLIDEVLSVGDRKFAAKAKAQLANKIGDGQTTVLVSHNVSEVREICERCLVLGKGSVLFDGRTDDAIKFYMEAGTGH